MRGAEAPGSKVLSHPMAPNHRLVPPGARKGHGVFSLISPKAKVGSTVCWKAPTVSSHRLRLRKVRFELKCRFVPVALIQELPSDTPSSSPKEELHQAYKKNSTCA